MADAELGDRGDLRREDGAALGAAELAAIADRDCLVRAERFVRCAYELAGKGQDYEHPVAVGDLLATLGCSDVVVAAGVLHRVVADTPVTAGQIAAAFGDEVAALVGALTEDRAIDDYRQRKGALRASVQRSGRAGMLIFAADNLVRLRAADEAGVMIDVLELEHDQRSFELLVASGIRSQQVDELGWRLRVRRAGSHTHQHRAIPEPGYATPGSWSVSRLRVSEPADLGLHDGERRPLR